MTAVPERIKTEHVYASITSAVIKRCPVRDEMDYGTVTISRRANGESFELHSLAEYLRGFGTRRISHEDFTAVVARELSAHVSSTWQTAGMTCTFRHDGSAGDA